MSEVENGGPRRIEVSLQPLNQEPLRPSSSSGAVTPGQDDKTNATGEGAKATTAGKSAEAATSRTEVETATTGSKITSARHAESTSKTSEFLNTNASG